jgi:hypothetical protein
MGAWLTNECYLLGLPLQNWMWVLTAALVLYVVVLTVVRAPQNRAD